MDKHAISFFLLRSQPILVKNVRGQNMQIRTVDVTKCVKPYNHHSCREGQKSGKFCVTGGPNMVSCINTTCSYIEGIVICACLREMNSEGLNVRYLKDSVEKGR